PKLGPAGAQEMLHSGANDMGGTLMNESITRAAGGHYGQEVTPGELAQTIRPADRIPVRRDTWNGTLARYDSHDPEDMAPLVSRVAAQSPIHFLEESGVAVDQSSE